MNEPTIWFMQLHPKNPEAIDAKQIKRLLKKYGVIGIGAEWEDKNGKNVTTPDDFRSKMQIGDVVAIYSPNHADHCFVALVRVVGECYDSDIKDEKCWFDIVRKVEILDDNSAYWQQRFTEETGERPNKGLCFVKTLQPSYAGEFLNFWYNSIMKEKAMEKYIDLLRVSKNLIFTGAPGTGKTYLALQIARSIVLSDREKKLPAADVEKLLNERTMFVQFHPSYDYTDFVEGLRPIQGTDGQVGFKRQDGVLKKLCKVAIAAGKSDGVDNFEEVWSKFIADMDERHSMDNPLQLETPDRKSNFEVVVNGRGNLSFITSGSGKVQGSLTKMNIRSFYVNPDKKDPWQGYFNGVISYLKNEKRYLLKDYVEGKDVDVDSRQKFVMIIDEINRGDISKIFGELFYAIDDGYRGPKGKVHTQYQNLVEDGDVFGEGFYMPENVYILGTMNDIDRNVESMDFAIRRRFTWEEIKPTRQSLEMMLSDLDLTGDVRNSAGDRMEALNKEIAKTPGLGPAYEIGPSYFRKLVNYKETSNDGFDMLWEKHLMPLIREYLRGLSNADDAIKKLFAAYTLKSTSERPDDSED